MSIPGLPQTGGLSRAQVEAAIAAAPTGQPRYVETVDVASGMAASALQANRAYLAHVRVAEAITLSKATIYVATASGNIDIAIYRSDGTTLTRLASTGSTAIVGTAAVQTINFTAPVELVPGEDYYPGFAVDNATASLGRIALNLTWTFHAKRILTYSPAFPFPASLALADATGTSSAPVIILEP